MVTSLKQFYNRVSQTFVGRIVTSFFSDKIGDLAAALTYYLLFSFFPLLLAIVSLLSLVGVTPVAIQTLIPIIHEHVPEQVAGLITEPLLRFSTSSLSGISLAGSLIVLTWSSSRYFTAFGRMQDQILNIDPKTNGIILKLRSLGVTFSLIILGFVTLLLFLSKSLASDWILERIPALSVVTPYIDYLRLPLMLLVGFATVWLLYLATPSESHALTTSGRTILPGALFAVVVCTLATWAITSLVFLFRNYDAIYGTLAGVIIGMLWSWLINVILLLGATINEEITQRKCPTTET